MTRWRLILAALAVAGLTAAAFSVAAANDDPGEVDRVRLADDDNTGATADPFCDETSTGFVDDDDGSGASDDNAVSERDSERSESETDDSSCEKVANGVSDDDGTGSDDDGSGSDDDD